MQDIFTVVKHDQEVQRCEGFEKLGQLLRVFLACHQPTVQYGRTSVVHRLELIQHRRHDAMRSGDAPAVQYSRDTGDRQERSRQRTQKHTDSPKCNEHNASLKVTAIKQVMTQLRGDGGLADARRAPDGHQPVCIQQTGDLVHLNPALHKVVDLRAEGKERHQRTCAAVPRMGNEAAHILWTGWRQTLASQTGPPTDRGVYQRTQSLQRFASRREVRAWAWGRARTADSTLRRRVEHGGSGIGQQHKLLVLGTR